MKNKGKHVELTAENKKGEVVTLEADYCLVAVGRKPYTEGLGLEKAGVQMNQRGQIEVNDSLQTNQAHIYAIGDVVRGAMLAHKAEEEGVIAAEVIAGKPVHMHHRTVPGIVYTWPELATVGLTEQEVKASGRAYRVGKFPFSASGKASAAGAKDGFVKMIYDAKYGELLGAHMIGANVTEMIAEIVTARKLETTGHEILKAVHPHPTMSEAVMEATAAAYGEVIHL